MGKIVEIVILIAGLLVTAFFMISIPLTSYNDYVDYLARVEELNKPVVKPVLESITAELKEGVKYFANDLAAPKIADFIVNANYTIEGGEPYSELIEEDYSITSASDFYSTGGEITITYKNKTFVIEIELIPVALESISVSTPPHTVKYQSGDNFNADGMVITAKYNDGSTKIIPNDKYVVDTSKVLTESDTKISVSYTEGETVKTVDVPITVSATLDNGAVTRIELIDKAIVKAGDTLSNAQVKVNAVYESGNKKTLSPDEYIITGGDSVAVFGNKHSITISYADDPTKSITTDVVVRQTIQGENGVIVGGVSDTEDEYAIIDGVITPLGNTVSFAGGFSQAVLSGEEAYLTLSVTTSISTIGDITMRCGNSYCCFANGIDKSGGYLMKPLQINTILDLTINGKEVAVPATVVLKGCGPDAEYPPLFGIYYEFTFKDVALDAGVNEVKFKFKKSTEGAVNCWNESPSTLNIDYVHFDSVGSEVPENYTISGIEITSVTTPDYGMKFSDIKANAVGVIEGGQKVAISDDMYSVTISGGNEGATTFGFGKYTITVSLVSNPSIKAIKEFEIEEFESFEVLHAGVELDGGKVYYVFTGDCTAYKPEDIVFFDKEQKFDYTVEIAEGKFVLKIDATNLAVGTVYPHINVGGVNYDNGGANTNGDVRDRGLKYTEGQGVVFGGKSYIIKTEWHMPTLVIAETDGCVAVINNGYTSDKTLLGEYKWGSEGVTLTGGSKSKDSEYIGGIGGMDKKDCSVTYTFTISEDGKVDFLWNIAGNYYNSSTKGNNGLTNAGDHIKVTLDGEEISFNGIELSAGTGTATEIWWNLQQIVISDVALTAGTHTFTCTILNDGSGLNIGAMNIYFAAN